MISTQQRSLLCTSSCYQVLGLGGQGIERYEKVPNLKDVSYYETHPSMKPYTPGLTSCWFFLAGSTHLVVNVTVTSLGMWFYDMTYAHIYIYDKHPGVRLITNNNMGTPSEPSRAPLRAVCNCDDLNVR